MITVRRDAHPALWASFVALLAGLILLLSPWIYGTYGNSSAWNSWVSGAFIVSFAAIRMAHPSAIALSWLNVAFGIWVFVSPWIYRFDGGGLFVNNLCIGFIVFCAAIIGANSERTSHDLTSSSS
jgi:hypothetical protein